MEIVSQIFLLVVILKLPKLLCLPFYPSYAAFTFSIEITAIGLRDTVNYLKSIGFMLSNFFNYLIIVENILTTFKPKIVYNSETLIGDFLTNLRSGKLVEALLEKYIAKIDVNAEQQALMNIFIKQFPIRLLSILRSGELMENDLEKIIELSNQ